MKNKLMGIMIAVVTLVLLSAMCVSATEYYYEDFANVTPSYSDSKAHMYISIPNLADGTPTAEYSITDGTVHFKKSSYPQEDQTAIGNKVPQILLNYDNSFAGAEELFIEFDFMFGDNAKMATGGEVICYMYTHDKRFLINVSFQGLRHFSYATTSTATLSKNVWYSGLMHIRMTDGEVDVYQKLRDAEEYTYLQTIPLENRTSNNYYLQLYGDYRKDQDIYIDNVKVYDGLVSKGGFYEMDGVKIDDTDGVTAGILTVKSEILNGSLSETELFPVMTVFDANGRLLDCQIKTDFTLVPGTNEISLDYDVSEYGDSVSGGYVGFYLWKDMTSVRPVVEAVELN